MDDRDVFISHAEPDKPGIANELNRRLVDMGITTWFDRDSLVPGNDLQVSIRRGVRGARFVLALVTPNYCERSESPESGVAVELNEIAERRSDDGPRDFLLILKTSDVRIAQVDELFPSASDCWIEPLDEGNLSVAAKKLQGRIRPNFIDAARRVRDGMYDAAAGGSLSPFRYALHDLPAPFLSSDGVDLLAITGASYYDLSKAAERGARVRRKGFGFELDIEDEMLPLDGYTLRERPGVDRAGPPPWEIRLGDSARNHSAITEIFIALLRRNPQPRHIRHHRGRTVVTFLDVDPDILASCNLLMIPCGDVNPLLPLALRGFELRHARPCPAHHRPYDSSEKVVSLARPSGWDKGQDDHTGYLVLLPNPWNEDKALLACGGNTGLGTQAALLRARQALAGDRPFPRLDYPYAIVRAVADADPAIVDRIEELELGGTLTTR